MDHGQVVAFLGSLALLLWVVELVRRRRLKEQYSLLWLATCAALIVLSLWRGSLDLVADLIGIAYPPAALFAVGFGFVFLIMLQFSVAITRLSEENKRLSQRLAIETWKARQREKGAEETPEAGVNEAPPLGESAGL